MKTKLFIFLLIEDHKDFVIERKYMQIIIIMKFFQWWSNLDFFFCL